MILVIAEKPALGEAIADALPGKGFKKDGVITKGDYVITWAFGHLLTIKEPEDYDEKYKNWSLEDLPIYFEPWDHKPGATKRGMASKAARVKQIGALLKQADSVIHAGDVDEEGQLLIDELLRWCNYKGPVKRLDTSNTTVPALKKALLQMKDNRSCEADGWSAYGRELSDAIFGFNFTRYYTLKNKTMMPVGRVQTPTLGLVVHRDQLIEGHQKLTYYELFAELQVDGKRIESKYIPNPNDSALTDGKILNRSIIEEKRQRLQNASFSKIVIKKSLVKESPPLPFNLTKLNTYCSKKWGYNPDTVMQITQSLRDRHKAITYNRSDCQYLSEEHFKEAPQTIRTTAVNLSLAASAFDPSIKSKCFNDANITAHFAIIPSGETVDVSSFNTQEKNVYTAICNYYLAQFLPPAEREKTVLDIDLGNGEALHASGSSLVKAGYLSLLSSEEDKGEGTDEQERESVALCTLAAGMYSGHVSGTEIREKATKPPARYTQATLIEDMTRIAKFVDDPNIKALLMAKDQGKKGENGSIGTSATRPAIVSGLISRGLLEEHKKGKSTQLISTAKGRAFYEMLPDNIKGADTTARWWVMQEDIKSGTTTPEEMARSVLEEVKVVLRSGHGTVEHAEAFAGGGTGVILGTCPICGSQVVERRNSYSCSKTGCKVVFFKDNRLMASLGKRMSLPTAKALLQDGRVRLDHCRGKNGNLYSCYLIVSYDGDSPYPEFKIEMPGQSVCSTEDTLGPCPFCKKPMVRDSFGHYSCSGRQSGCTFRIFNTVAGKKLTDANVRDLLKNGRTRTLSNFKSNAGKSFDAALKLEDDGRISFVFANRPKKR